jgi:saccharopine dehydrogenase-like NADP-dependent oxidoreductase
VIIASGEPHALLVSSFIAQGVSVVSTSDNLADVLALTDLDALAKTNNAVVVAGAACSPGMSGLLVRHMARAFESIDEVHTAVHGTGGPMCARQHHDSLGGISVGWHDGEWLQRPAGSGRELCWFPDPVGARDCYRFASPEPVLMQRMAPELHRITARVSATRRDRLTARLPMLRKPHAEGLEGALRVEVRGVRNGKRHVEIVGIVDRLATIAGAVAAHTAIALATGTTTSGVHTLGQAALPNADILDAVTNSGIELHQFVGTE